MSDDARLSALENKVQELEAMVALTLRLLSIEKPVSALLQSYGAGQAEELAVHALLDDLARRAEQGGVYTPSFAGFEQELGQRFPKVRGNREFASLLLDALKIDRPSVPGPPYLYRPGGLALTFSTAVETCKIRSIEESHRNLG